MQSHILGKVNLNDQRLAHDLEYLANVPKVQVDYDEFNSGVWHNIQLWNASGDGADDLLRDVAGRVQITEHGQATTYLTDVVSEVFDIDQLTMVRTRNLVDGVIVPHRDFVELDKDDDAYFRILICLQGFDGAFHSEESDVISMRPGEIWYLNAAACHSAVNFTQRSRQLLCLDFAFDGRFHESDIFADKKWYQPRAAPGITQRPAVTEDTRKALRHIGSTVDRGNFKDFVFLVSKLHFTRDLSARGVYQLLQDSLIDADPALVDRVRGLQAYMLGDQRTLGEGFSLNVWDADQVGSR